MKNKYYVYLHKYKYGPKAGQVFYVGKGEGYRAYRKDRNPHWKHIEQNYGCDIDFVEKDMLECEAFSLEISEIAKYKAIGQAEANHTMGGEGMSGWTPDTIIPVVCSNGMKFNSMSDAAKWVSANTKYNATSGRISSACRGIRNSAYGFTWNHDGLSPPEYSRPDSLSAMSRMKIVLCSNGMRFASLTSAVEWLKENGHTKADKGAISNCCNGKSKSAYKLRWSYEKAPEVGA